ncbi:MAG: hypothetical protein HOM14_01705 [Gammaproteobacteria bacterium]|nr:hypothetical protein [Gammaproteobacteria bacterium]MBT3725085.1 hypothetical protein [Gammaproteobacteria bacterium]MBT4076112.1 hypothetical protein [Gammaproteobacteria bacterium]MBT4194399.1 hypothetical protein [Gammaproteobacteria bacterium]MBT4448457.1 hypothetical protein [Gammaproteobacteria bacterium]
MKSNIQQLSYALDLSDQILSAIADESLETISELDNERRLLINKYYKNNKTIDEKLTRELKLKNDLIVSQLVEMQQNTRSQQIKLNQSKKVSKAYLDNA